MKSKTIVFEGSVFVSGDVPQQLAEEALVETMGRAIEDAVEDGHFRCREDSDVPVKMRVTVEIVD